jgi:uncharacterized membrane protein YheB (UPF0754 family)
MMTTSHSNLWALISIPVIAALIGYITNYIAVRMIFRPHKPVRLMGITFHGLVPKRQKEIAASLGSMIERDLFSHEDIHRALQSSETTEEASKFLSEQVDLFANRMVSQNPMIGAFIQGPLLDQIKTMLQSQMADRFPQFMERVVERVEHRLDVSAIVQAKIEAFDLGKLESIINEISRRELKAIEVLGGVLGFLVGLIQLGLMAL